MMILSTKFNEKKAMLKKTKPAIDYRVDSEKNEYFLSAYDLGITISKAMADHVMAEVRANKSTARDHKVTVYDGEGEMFEVYVSQIMRILDYKDRIIFENDVYDVSDYR